MRPDSKLTGSMFKIFQASTNGSIIGAIKCVLVRVGTLASRFGFENLVVGITVTLPAVGD
jgi:hypothetical protein